jgi:LPS sulfotransferase NodH
MTAGRYTGANMVFLVGCPRSGTTWLQKLLASHPKIRSAEESHVFSIYVGPQLRAWKRQAGCGAQAGSAHVVGPPAYMTKSEFSCVLRTYTLQLFEPVLKTLAPDEVFLEKTPSHALFIPEIKEVLPDARFIHLLRDPRDVVGSLLAASRTWGSDWAPRGASAAARIWLEHVTAARAAAEHLSRDEFHEVTYEKLCDAPVEALTGVANFLRLDWSRDSMSQSIEANMPFATGTPIPIFGAAAERNGAVSKLPAGFVRRARPGAWKKDLRLRDKLRVVRIAGRYMHSAGYEWRLADWF